VSLCVFRAPHSIQIIQHHFSKLEDYKPAFIEKYCCCKTEIDAIITNSDVPTFENTIVALDFAGEQLDRLSSIFF
jgi:peptidyl-dipeptidase Dcp